jgi:SNF2 family DNA or RNA helicase
MRRVAKEDVLTDLPPKTYQTRVVKLPPAYRAAYEEMKKDMIAHLPDSPDEPLEVMSTLAQLQRLTQLASSACDVEVEMVLEEREDHPLFGELVPKTHVYPREPSWKIDELMAILDGSQGSPLITFSPHTSLVNLAGKRAASHGYRVGYITGEQSKVKKTLTRKAFQRGEIDLLCCNTAAGGVGLNLTAASTMVFLERSFAFWQADQNEGRIHRRGQTEQVTIIDIVAENTIESKIRAAMRTKAESLSVLVRDQRIVESFLRDQPIHV